MFCFKTASGKESYAGVDAMEDIARKSCSVSKPQAVRSPTQAEYAATQSKNHFDGFKTASGKESYAGVYVANYEDDTVSMFQNRKR